MFFIRLTNWNPNNAAVLWVNPAKITRLRQDEGEGVTQIFTEESEESWDVKETPEEVLQLIRKGEIANA